MPTTALIFPTISWTFFEVWCIMPKVGFYRDTILMRLLTLFIDNIEVNTIFFSVTSRGNLSIFQNINIPVAISCIYMWEMWSFLLIRDRSYKWCDKSLCRWNYKLLPWMLPSWYNVSTMMTSNLAEKCLNYNLVGVNFNNQCPVFFVNSLFQLRKVFILNPFRSVEKNNFLSE